MRALLLNYWLLYRGLSDNHDFAVLDSCKLFGIYICVGWPTPWLKQDLWQKICALAVNSLVPWWSSLAHTDTASSDSTAKRFIFLYVVYLSKAINRRTQATQNLCYSHDVIISKIELRLPVLDVLLSTRSQCGKGWSGNETTVTV